MTNKAPIDIYLVVNATFGLLVKTRAFEEIEDRISNLLAEYGLEGTIENSITSNITQIKHREIPT